MSVNKKLVVVSILLICGALSGLAWRYFKSVKIESKQLVFDFSFESLKEKPNIVPLLVLGSGPASLAAALYGSRTNIRTVVIKGNQPGGQLTGTSYIENWPGVRKIRGTEIIKDCEEQAARFGAIMVSDSVQSVDFTQWPYKVITEEGKELHALSLFIGTGATPRKLGIPGEWKYFGKGVTTCAICDAPFHKGDEVVVIGGGDSAVEEAIELSSYARQIRMLVRGDVMRASPTMIDRLADCSNVKIVYNTTITEIYGVDDHVKGIQVINTKTNEKEEWKDVKGVFLAIGHIPNTQIFNGQLETTKEGYLKMLGRSHHTSQKGVFAAGDVSDPRYKQAGVAAGDGIKGGLDAVWWLSESGFSDSLQKDLEPFFFDPRLDNKIDMQRINNIAELDELIAHNLDKIIIVDFYTKFCPSCIHMMPVLEWAGTKLKDKVICVKVDGIASLDLTSHFEAPGVPYFVVLKKGKQVGATQDMMNREEMYNFIKKHL
ncbi:FAD-dependent oxidoreductase [Candidatus Babeliales bacterium]|nr:FAD-dependent oxidoreductase [Candidatus Babeliales bacterium]